MSHIPIAAKNRRKAIEERLNKQRKSDKNLKFQIRPGESDLKILIKYKIDNLLIHNPYKEVKIEDFDPHMELPPIETVALKIHQDNAIQAQFRARYEEAEK